MAWRPGALYRALSGKAETISITSSCARQLQKRNAQALPVGERDATTRAGPSWAIQWQRMDGDSPSLR